MAEPTKEISILVHGMNITNPDCAWADRVIKEVWFLLERTSDGGLKATEMFQETDLSIDCSETAEADYCFRLPSYVQIGNFLYVIGGKGHKIPTISNQVRYLDIKNPENGWKACRSLQRPCDRADVCAQGNLIYVLPFVSRDAFIYDTSDSNQQEYSKKLQPPSLVYWELLGPYTCDIGDGRHVPLALSAKTLYFYDSDTSSWCCLVEELPLPTYEFTDVRNRAFLNGILYLSQCDWNHVEGSTFVVWAYDVRMKKATLGDGITVPKFKKFQETGWMVDEMCLVAVADYKLCYVWPFRKFQSVSDVFIATVDFSPCLSSSSSDPDVREEMLLELDVGNIQRFIPFDSTCKA